MKYAAIWPIFYQCGIVCRSLEYKSDRKMPNDLIQYIDETTSKKSVTQYAIKNRIKAKLFEKMELLGNRTLYRYLTKYGSYCSFTLSDFIENQWIDLRERDSNDRNLMANLVRSDDLVHFQLLLLQGEKPTEQMFIDSEDSVIGTFLRYRPGKRNHSVFEFTTKRTVDLAKLQQMILDYEDTTDDESSESELSDTEELSSEQEEIYNQRQLDVIEEYNRGGDAKSMVLVAARGVHFMRPYFPKTTREHVRSTRRTSHTTYSMSTLLDAGYTTDDEPEISDLKIQRVHKRNLQFVDRLKASEDKGEKKCDNRPVPVNRKNRVFISQYWREMQMYINSYDTLFNLRGISINFAFESDRNPHLSLSWKTANAGLYAGGIRIKREKGGWLDPHYRRFDGRPKHPIVGYIDIYEFPLDYVRAYGVDRLLAFNDGKIDLSVLFRSEAEIIFHSVIPAEFHVRRYLIVVPSFTKVASKARDESRFFGMKGGAAYTKAYKGLQAALKGKRDDNGYDEWVALRIRHAVSAQSALIDSATRHRLFSENKVQVYDHGDEVAATLPKPIG